MLSFAAEKQAATNNDNDNDCQTNDNLFLHFTGLY